MKTKEYDFSHRCEKMRNQQITGVIIQIDGMWYEVRGNDTHLIQFCPNCGFDPSKKDCYPYGKEPKQ